MHPCVDRSHSARQTAQAAPSLHCIVRVPYARVSTDGQTLASQDAQLHAAGCAKVYSEKASGARTDRPELAKLLRRLDEGDVLMVTRLDRLARSTRRGRRYAGRSRADLRCEPSHDIEVAAAPFRARKRGRRMKAKPLGHRQHR